MRHFPIMIRRHHHYALRTTHYAFYQTHFAFSQTHFALRIHNTPKASLSGGFFGDVF